MWYRIKEVKAMTNLSDYEIRKMIKNNEVKSEWLGNCYKIPEEEVIRLKHSLKKVEVENKDNLKNSDRDK